MIIIYQITDGVDDANNTFTMQREMALKAGTRCVVAAANTPSQDHNNPTVESLCYNPRDLLYTEYIGCYISGTA